jgi:hypothetical protein
MPAAFYGSLAARTTRPSAYPCTYPSTWPVASRSNTISAPTPSGLNALVDTGTSVAPVF